MASKKMDLRKNIVRKIRKFILKYCMMYKKEGALKHYETTIV